MPLIRSSNRIIEDPDEPIAEMGVDALTVATGGLSPLIFEHAQCLDKLDPLLTLRGLEIVYRRNHS